MSEEGIEKYPICPGHYIGCVGCATCGAPKQRYLPGCIDCERCIIDNGQ